MGEAKRRAQLQEAVEKVTAQLTDQGLIIEAGFASLKLMAFPDAPADQVKFGRELFFAGARHLLSSIMTVLEDGDEPTDQDLDRMAKIEAELERFEQQFVAQLPTAGRA